MAQGTPYYIGVSDHKYDEEYVEACTKKVGYAPVGIFHLGCAVLSNTGAEAVGLVFEGREARTLRRETMGCRPYLLGDASPNPP